MTSKSKTKLNYLTGMLLATILASATIVFGTSMIAQTAEAQIVGHGVSVLVACTPVNQGTQNNCFTTATNVDTFLDNIHVHNLCGVEGGVTHCVVGPLASSGLTVIPGPGVVCGPPSPTELDCILNPGESITLQDNSFAEPVAGIIPYQGRVDWRDTCSAGAPGCSTADQIATAGSSKTVIPTPTTTLTKTATPGIGAAGDTISYNITETINPLVPPLPIGAFGINNIAVDDSNIAGTNNFNSGNLAGGDDGDGVLEPGETWFWTYDYVLTADNCADGTHVNTAVSTGTVNGTDVQHPPETAEETVQCIVTTTLTKTATPSSGVPGDTITYNITESNPATSVPIDNVVVDDSNIAGTNNFNSTNLDGGDNGNGVLDPGETWFWVYDHVLTAEECADGTHFNTADATGTIQGTTIPAPPEHAEETVTCVITPVGGEILPIDMSAMVLAGGIANVFWILPVLAAIVGATVVLTRMHKKD